MNAQIMLVFNIGDCGEGRLYAGIVGRAPDRFAGELYFHKGINFQEAAELFGGELVYPQDLENQGFDKGQDLALRAAIHYEAAAGSFGVKVTFTRKWDGLWGCGAFCMMRMQGSVEYTGGPDGQYLFSLSGKFNLGKTGDAAVLQGEAVLSLAAKSAQTDQVSSGAEADHKLPATVLSLKCTCMEPGNFISSLTGTDSYGELPVPVEYVDKKPNQFMELQAELNLTDTVFEMRGKYQFRENAALDAMFYLAKQDEEYRWWMVLQMHLLSLSDISSDLEGVSQFIGLGEMDAEVILSNTVQTIVVSDQQMYNLTIRRGLTFRVKMELQDSFLREVVDMKGDCIISGFIPAQKGEAIILSGSVQKIVFLEFLDVNDLHISLTKERGNTDFLFRAEGELQLSFQEFALPKIRAEIVWEEDEAQKRVELCGRVGKMENPLGIPNTVLEEISFHAISRILFIQNMGGTVEKREKSFYFKGGVTIAGILLEAWILFAGTRPAVVRIEVGEGRGFSISHLVSQYCGCGWNDYLDISLYHGAISYCPGEKDLYIDGKYYKHGFHAQVDTRIFFFPEMRLSVAIDSEGLLAKAQLREKFNLAFLGFYLEEEDEEGQTITVGPEVSIGVIKKNHERQFALRTRVEIFTRDVGEAYIVMTKSKFRGELSFPEQIPIDGTVGFTIDDQGFRLDQCAVPDFKLKKIKIPAMNLGNGGPGCHVKILESPKIKTSSKVEFNEFTWKANCMTATFDLFVTLKSESIFSADGGDEFVVLPFLELPLEISKEDCDSVSFEKLTEVLLRNIANITGKMFEQVITLQCLDDVLTEEGIKKLLRFLTIEGMVWGVNELVSYLICKGMKVLIAEMLTEALTSLASSSLTVMEGVILLLGGLLGTMDSKGNYTAGKRAPKENKDEPEKNPQRPQVPGLSFEEDKLYIRWRECKNAQGYYPVITDADEAEKNTNVIADQYEKTNTGEFQTCVMGMPKPGQEDSIKVQNLYRVYYGREYHVSVYAWNLEGAATGPPAAIYLPNRPANMKVQYFCMEKKLHIMWDEVDKIDEYMISITWEEQGEIRKKTETRGKHENEARIGQEPGKAVSVSVRGTTANAMGPSAVWDDFWLYDLKAPENVLGSRGNEGIVVKWDRVLYADRYRVTWCRAAGAQEEMQVIHGTEFNIPADRLQEDVCYQIQVQPMTDSIEGRVSPQISVLWNLLATPEIMELVCRKDGIMEVVLEAKHTRYRQLVYQDGRVAALDEQQIPCEWETSGQAKVRLVESERQGQWSKPISLQPLPLPEAVNAFVQDGYLCVHWSSSGDSYQYGMEVVAGEKIRIIEPLDGTEYRADLSDFTETAVLRVCLYTIDGADTRRRSESVEVTLRI